MQHTTDHQGRQVKTCPTCGLSKPLDQFWRDASRGDGLDNRCRACKGESNRRWRQDDPERTNEILRHHRSRLRQAVFDHYGWICACPGCNATTRLTIDHIDGDGRTHREELFGRPQSGSTEMYRWLVKNDFPDGFQTLCGPCNSSKMTVSACRLDHTGAGRGAKPAVTVKRGKITGQALENIRIAQQRRRERERAERKAREGGEAG